MSHMVIYRSVDGKPGFQQTDDLLSAVEFVERLRNTEGVENARIYRLEQVNFRFQPYFQVHLDQAEPPNAPRPLVATAATQPAPAVQPAPVAQPAPMPSQLAASAPAAAPMASATPAPVPPAGPDPALPGEQLHPGTVADGGDPNDLGNGIRRGLFGR